MKLHLFRLSSAVTALSLAILACSFAVPTISPTNTPPTVQPSAQIDGPKIVTGSVTYTNSFFTEGAGGSVEQFLMPENISTQITIGRAVDAQGNIHLEGKGVVPTVKVLVTTDTLQKEANGEDVVLDAAVAFLNK